MTLKIQFKVKLKVTIMKAIYDKLLVFNSNHVPYLHIIQVTTT